MAGPPLKTLICVVQIVALRQCDTRVGGIDSRINSGSSLTTTNRIWYSRTHNEQLIIFVINLCRGIYNDTQVARDSLRVLLDGEEPGIEALHAGLECGVIGDKAPGMDIVSSRQRGSFTARSFLLLLF